MTFYDKEYRNAFGKRSIWGLLSESGLAFGVVLYGFLQVLMDVGVCLDSI